MIWEIAGEMGVDPRPYTLGQFLAMHRGFCRRLAIQTGAATGADPAKLDPYTVDAGHAGGMTPDEFFDFMKGQQR